MNLADRIVAVLERGDNFGLGIIETLNAEKRVWFARARVYPLLRHLVRIGVLLSYGDYRFSAQRGGRPRVYYRFNMPRVHFNVLLTSKAIGHCGLVYAEAPAFDSYTWHHENVTCPRCRDRAVSAGLLARGETP